MAFIDFGRDLCSDFSFSSKQEWLVTNGIGGYASGTIGGILTRRYHGLLIAALKPPVGRTLLLTKLDERVTYDEKNYTLFCNHWANGVIEPQGYLHIERFHLEGTTPVWTFSIGDAQIEKRIWMQPRENTSYIHYHLVRASETLEIEIKMFVNFRNHHDNTSTGDFETNILPVREGIQIQYSHSDHSLFVLSIDGKMTLEKNWYQDYFLSQESYRGLNPIDDHLLIGTLKASLEPGSHLGLVASTNPNPNLDSRGAYSERESYENQLIIQSGNSSSPQWLQQLILDADQFNVERHLPNGTTGGTVIAGYHWFGDWGRDTMISLPGLTLTTGRENFARKILHTFAQYVDQGMLPNNFPEVGEKPDYNSVDATLWYFEAIRAYFTKTKDRSFLEELFPVLSSIIDWFNHGTRYQIQVDPEDGLVYAGERGVQLTWMDAKVEDWVVTPRTGKPIEINALWYNALRIMGDFANQIEKPGEEYHYAADKNRTGFQRFWNQSRGYCFDVIDGPHGDDPALRPNQLIAVSLGHSPLSQKQKKAVVDVCARALWTSHGLRSLAPSEPNFIGQYGGDRRQRDGAYHQGTVWGWLIGPFVSAHLRVYRQPEKAFTYLLPLIRQMKSHGLGTLSEIFDGDPPFTPRGCISQAWSVAEVLRVWQEIMVEIK
jgi:predicted glycogen debranching enzyme